MKPEADIKTEIGILTVIANRETNCYVRTQEGGKSLIRGKEVEVGVHFTLQASGSWYAEHISVNPGGFKKATDNQERVALSNARYALETVLRTQPHIFRNAQDIENSERAKLLREELGELESRKVAILAEISRLERE